MNPFKNILISVLVMSALADSALAKSDCKGISGHRKCDQKDECQWAFKKIGAKSKSCIDYVKVITDVTATIEKVTDVTATIEKVTDVTATIEKVTDVDATAEKVTDVTATIEKVTDVDATAEYTFLNGCCREKESGNSHHDEAEMLELVGANKQDAMDQCEKACNNKNGKCGAYEFTASKKNKKSKKKKKSNSLFEADCELHMHKKIDSATKSSVSCRKRATCAVRTAKVTAAPISAPTAVPTWEKYWQELSPDEKDGAEALGWDQSSWDHEAPWPNSTHVPWADLTSDEQEGATKLNFDAESWKAKCPLDHAQRKAYQQDFADLTDREQEGAVALGWNETTWDADVTTIHGNTFAELTEDERTGAYKLHFCEETWNSHCPDGASRDYAWKNSYWADLSGDFQTSAVALGWSETTWNEESGTVHAPSEFTLWADLTKTEREHAANLDWCEVEWDFHVVENQDCRTQRKSSHCILAFETVK